MKSNLLFQLLKLLLAIVVILSILYLITIKRPHFDIQSNFNQRGGDLKDKNTSDQSTLSRFADIDNPEDISTLPDNQITEMTVNNGILLKFNIGVI